MPHQREGRVDGHDHRTERAGARGIAGAIVVAVLLAHPACKGQRLETTRERVPAATGTPPKRGPEDAGPAIVKGYDADAACSATVSGALPPLADPDPLPTRNFAKIAEAVGFYDARAVSERLVVVGCKRVRVLDESLDTGRDVPGLAIPEPSCVSIVGVSGPTLVVYAKGAGLLGVDVPSGAVRWREPATLSAECDRGKQAKAAYGGVAGTHWSRYEFLDATKASTCRSVVVSRGTVVAAEGKASLVGRSADTGVTSFRQDGIKVDPAASLLADDQGHVFEVLSDPKVLVALDASNDQTLWKVPLDPPPFDSAIRSSSDEEQGARGWDSVLGATPSGPWVEWSDRTVLLGGRDGAELACLRRERTSPPVKSLGPYVVSLRASRRIAFDARSVFATDEEGSLVAYRRGSGDKEWSFDVLALGLEMAPKALFTQPRVEWVGSKETLVGLGIGETGLPVLSLFRKKNAPEADRTVTVDGDVTSWAGPSDDLSWMRIKVGPSEVTPDKRGHFSLQVSTHGKLRVSSADGWSLKSHLEPQTVDVDLDGTASVIHVKLAVVRHEEPHEVPQPGQ